MIEGRLARRYATALFQLAREAGQEEQVGRELAQFYAAYSGSELQGSLSNPAFAAANRKRILIQVANALQASVLTTHFLSLLLERDRLGQLAAVLGSYQRLLNEAKGRVEAKVVLATPLEPKQRDQLVAALRAISGKEVLLREEADPELIGGLVVELEGRVYDGSVRMHLDRMRQRIARGY
jgi:F-type H+-transporting ATPase subunit delta